MPSAEELKVVREQQARERAEDEAATRALAEPLPGPAADVFKLPADITVGPYRVRPFYDVDFEFLSALRHPFLDMMKRGMAKGSAPDDEAQMPTGADAWNLCWIMTRHPDEVDELIAKEGLDGLRWEARAKFSRNQLRGLAALYTAIVRQLGVYWAPYIGYGPPKGDDEEGSGQPDRPPQSSGAQPTASAG